MKDNGNTELSDREIIERVLAGRSDEFKRLVIRYQDPIYSLLLRQVGSKHVAEELTQDTFLRAYGGLPRFAHRSSFQTWLTRIALNVSNSYFASRTFREMERNVAYSQELHDAAAAQDEEGRGLPEASLTLLQQALGTLKPKFREPLVLCRLEGKTYGEAGAMLGIPAGTVCSRMNTALAQLRRYMKRRGQ